MLVVVWYVIRPRDPTIMSQLLHPLCYKVGLLAWCDVYRVLYQQRKDFVSPEVMVLVATLRARKANPQPAYAFILVRVNPCPFLVKQCKKTQLLQMSKDHRSISRDLYWVPSTAPTLKKTNQSLDDTWIAPLQGIFPTQESNPGLLHYWWILYHLSYQGGPDYNWTFFFF